MREPKIFAMMSKLKILWKEKILPQINKEIELKDWREVFHKKQGKIQLNNSQDILKILTPNQIDTRILTVKEIIIKIIENPLAKMKEDMNQGRKEAKMMTMKEDPLVKEREKDQERGRKGMNKKFLIIRKAINNLEMNSIKITNMVNQKEVV